MSNKLFVGGLASETTDETLRNAFAAHGEVTEARVILDRETRRSRGFGFVRYATPEQAQAALESMAGAMVDGRSIRVDLAEDRRGGPPGGANRGPGGPPPPRRSGPSGSAPVVARRGGGGPGGPPRGAPSRPEVWTPGPPPEEEEAGWDDARIRRTERKQKARKPTEEAKPRPTRGAPPRQRRSSGKTWRDWAVDDDDDDLDD